MKNKIKRKYWYEVQKVRIPSNYRTYTFIPAELKRDDFKWMSKHREFDYLWNDGPDEEFKISHIRYEW